MPKKNTLDEIDVIHPIHTIYFYHVDRRGIVPSTTAYYHFDENDRIRDDVDLRRLIKMLIQNVKTNDHAPPPCGDGFGKVLWRRRSHLVILLDDPKREFSSKRDVDIVFKDDPRGPNHSFFNPRLMEVDYSGDNSGRMVPVFHCINLMRHKEGRDMHAGESEEHQVVLFPGSRTPVRFDDDGGTNQGGPLPPIVEY